jgi:hypothetical protein
MALKPEEMSDQAKLRMASAATAHIGDVQARQVALEDMLVRAWAVEQAVKLCQVESEKFGMRNLPQTMNEIYEFVMGIPASP